MTSGGGRVPRSTFLVFGAPDIREPEIEEVVSTLRSGWIGTGPKVARFEREFRDYKGQGYAVAVGSCTAGLHLSLLAAGIQPGDEVITTALTFCATVNAIIHAGAKPVVVDVDPRTFNIDPEQIEARVTKATKAILPVHFAGHPCDMDAVCGIASRRGLKIIEDCAHALESRHRGQPVGSFGEFACFSFYVTKNVTTGEGGMILTRSPEAAGKVKVLALHGMSQDAWDRYGDKGFKHYQVVAAGFKYNMMDIQAAIGIHQLRRVEENWRRRREIWQVYDRAFADLPVTPPVDAPEQHRHGYHLYTLLIDRERCGVERDVFLDRLTEQKIGAGVHYRCLADQPFYRETYGWKPEEHPNATRIGRQTVSLPLSPRLSDADVEDVIHAVRHALSR